MATSKKDQILQLFKQMDVVRPRDAEAAGIAGSYLNALYSRGILERPSRGLYTLPNSEPNEFRSIVEACKLSPLSLSQLGFASWCGRLHPVSQCTEPSSSEPTRQLPRQCPSKSRQLCRFPFGVRTRTLC
ncbi:MAG: type IV toxin-antitoxin system AbiEi family antitoxin domain-containing protein [Planctomycetaceae bacterium]|nr:type IV toxin-antitoxin system AbiEi family antitoxin domain-containing protein [Planctomycetaceae bacterium]